MMQHRGDCKPSRSRRIVPLIAARYLRLMHNPAPMASGLPFDDFRALLAALPPNFDLETLSLPSRTRVSRIGSLVAGKAPLSLTHAGEPVDLPERLGFEHAGDDDRGLSAPPMADRP